MTNQERAEKIAEWMRLGVCRHQPEGSCSKCLISGILEQLDEAVRKALNRDHPCHATGYREDFAAARDKARLCQMNDTGTLTPMQAAESMKQIIIGTLEAQ